MGEPIDWKSNTSIRNVLNSIACIEIDLKKLFKHLMVLNNRDWIEYICDKQQNIHKDNKGEQK